MNCFYCRFDSHDFSSDHNDILNDLRNNEDDPLIIHEHEVAKLFHNLKPNKACGPDNITPNILNSVKKSFHLFIPGFLTGHCMIVIYPSSGKLQKYLLFQSQKA